MMLGEGLRLWWCGRQIDYPDSFPATARDLIEKLLVIDHTQRLGSTPESYAELRVITMVGEHVLVVRSLYTCLAGASILRRHSVELPV